MHKNNQIAWALLATSLLTTPQAYAYTHGKPGLWETSAQMTFNSGAPQIPPEALERMKQMGIQPPNFNNPHISKACVTPEQAASDKPPKIDDHDSGCQIQNVKIDNGSYSADQVCTGQVQGKGTVKVTYDSDTHYSGAVKFTGGSHGQSVDTTTNFSGRWLGADCGTVQPFSP